MRHAIFGDAASALPGPKQLHSTTTPRRLAEPTTKPNTPSSSIAPAAPQVGRPPTRSDIPTPASSAITMTPAGRTKPSRKRPNDAIACSNSRNQTSLAAAA